MAGKIEVPYATFKELDGTPLESGFIYIGTAGLNPETNAVSVYIDEALTLPIAQPIRTIGGAPVAGPAPVELFISGSQYSITIKDKNGGHIDTVLTETDEASSLRTSLASITDTALGSALVGVFLSATGYVGRTLSAWIAARPFYVCDFGAVGDGSTDDQAAFQAASDAASAAGGGTAKVGIPETSYKLKSSVAIRDDVVFEGEGFASLIVSDAVSASTYSCFLLYGDRCGIRNFRIDGSADIDDSKGFTHVWFIDEGSLTTPGAGPTDSFAENIQFNKTSNQGFALVGTTRCRVIDCQAINGKGHGIAFSNDTDSYARNFYAEGIEEKTGGGSGKYGFDISDGCINTSVDGAIIRNCLQGFKIEDASGDQAGEYNTVKNVKIIGGTKSEDRAVQIVGPNSHVSNIVVDGHPGSVLGGSEDRVFYVAAAAVGSTIEDIYITGVTHSIIGMVNEADNVNYRRLNINSAVNTAFRNNGGDNVLIDGFNEAAVTTTSINVINNGAVITDFTLKNAYMTDDLVFDENTEASSVTRCTLENIYSSGGGINMGDTPIDWSVRNVHMVKSGSKPFQAVDPTDVRMIDCVGDSVTAADNSFRFTGTKTRLSLINCTAKNGNVGFNAASGTEVDCMIAGCMGVGNTTDESGFEAGGTYIYGNTFSPPLVGEASMTADDVTPTVKGIRTLLTVANAGATAITALDNAVAGQTVTLICNSATNAPTIADSGNFNLSAAWAPGTADTLTLYSANGTSWRELARSDN